jgi:two-component system, sensor histidine kinase RegB
MALAQPSRSTPGAPGRPETGGATAIEWEAALERRGRLRVRTLVQLRWLAVIGQIIAVAVAAFVLKFPLPLSWCISVIAASAWLNVYFHFSLPGQHLAKDWEATLQLAFDVLQLAALLGLTGGLTNPFCLLLISPATVAAATLRTRHAAVVVLLAIAAASVLWFVYLPLPWAGAGAPVLPPLYREGVWVAVIVGVLFTAGASWQAAAEASRMELALAATQRVLAREQRLAALGGLAAAAAHELGTPLATIQVVAKELLRSSPPDDPVADDARLLLQQAERCRDILKTLAQKPETGDIVHARLGLAQLIEEVAEPYRAIGPEVITLVEGPPGEFVPDVRRLPEIVHALSAFVENAADFAHSVVEVTARFEAEAISVEVRDDGPGFSSDVLLKLGEPYVTSRPQGEGSRSHHQGMGLGFFIAKTLLERTGAEVNFGNERTGGAVIITRWPRPALEAPDTLEHRGG